MFLNATECICIGLNRNVCNIAPYCFCVKRSVNIVMNCM